MKTKLIAGMVIALLIGNMAIAQRGSGQRGDFNRGERYNLSDRLELTDDQQAKINEMRVAHFSATQELRDQLKTEQVKLDDLMNNDQIDQKSIEKTVNKMGEIRTELMLARVNHRIEVRSILNDEQKMKFDMMARHHGPKHRGRNW